MIMLNIDIIEHGTILLQYTMTPLYYLWKSKSFAICYWL